MSDERNTVPLFSEPATEPSIRMVREPGQFINRPITKLDLALQKLRAAHQQAYAVVLDDRSAPVETRYHLLTMVQMVGNLLSCMAAAKRGE